MAVDLGTTKTLVYVRGRGIVLSEPSVVAVNARTGEVHAVGIEAKHMLERAPRTISAIRPLKDGVIADFEVTEKMLRHFIHKVHQNRWAHPRVVVCVPSGVNAIEKRAVEEACLSAGARQAYLIDEPMAAAIGAELPVGEPVGSMIVDIGGGTSEVAVISLGGIVVSKSIRVGGDELDKAIINYVKREHNLLIGQQTAEEVKLEIGSAYPMSKPLRSEIRARDTITELPKTVVLTSEEIQGALEKPVSQIIDAVKETLDRTPPELASDIMDRGIMLAGGGSLLQGLEERLRHEMQMPAHLAELPLTCVAVGSGRSLENLEETVRQRWVKLAGDAELAIAKMLEAVASGVAASPVGTVWPRLHDEQGLTASGRRLVRGHTPTVSPTNTTAPKEITPPGEVAEVDHGRSRPLVQPNREAVAHHAGPPDRARQDPATRRRRRSGEP